MVVLLVGIGGVRWAIRPRERCHEGGGGGGGSPFFSSSSSFPDAEDRVDVVLLGVSLVLVSSAVCLASVMSRWWWRRRWSGVCLSPSCMESRAAAAPGAQPAPCLRVSPSVAPHSASSAPERCSASQSQHDDDDDDDDGLSSSAPLTLLKSPLPSRAA